MKRDRLTSQSRTGHLTALGYRKFKVTISNILLESQRNITKKSFEGLPLLLQSSKKPPNILFSPQNFTLTVTVKVIPL